MLNVNVNNYEENIVNVNTTFVLTISELIL